MKHLQKQDEEKIMALHYIVGIDFPLFHEPPYPVKREDRKMLLKDPHGKKFVRDAARCGRRRQYQRG